MGVLIASDTDDNFDLSGPKHLSQTDVNWDDEYHRKLVAACLVQGVYVLENDRQKKRKGSNSLACRWWEFFHFQLHKTLIDDVDSSIFGVIYEFKPQSSMCKDTLHKSPPRYVIVFRGTTIKLKSVLRDMMLDIKILTRTLHRTSRSKTATETVRDMVASVGGNGSNIWLAGHSLGSYIALHAGKTMAKSGIFIESFLFNPPFPSAPLDQLIKSEKKKRRIRKFVRVIKTGIYIFNESSFYDSFSALSPWSPSLFVNPSDFICSEYVGYFEHRRKMEHRAGSNGNIEAQISLISLMINAFGKECDPLHLIPSANLTVNLTTPPPQSIMEAHGIHQWWQPKLILESKEHKY